MPCQRTACCLTWPRPKSAGIFTSLHLWGSPRCPHHRSRHNSSSPFGNAQPSPFNIQMDRSIAEYNNRQTETDRHICNLLAETIDSALPGAESKIWHAHPVWFLNGNPTVGYSRQKKGVRLMFWSGADFDAPGLDVKGKRFKDASVFYNSATDIDTDRLAQWLKESRRIQWNYKDIIKHKGKLQRLK